MLNIFKTWGNKVIGGAKHTAPAIRTYGSGAYGAMRKKVVDPMIKRVKPINFKRDTKVIDELHAERVKKAVDDGEWV